jgi:hypothetical protein
MGCVFAIAAITNNYLFSKKPLEEGVATTSLSDYFKPSWLNGYVWLTSIAVATFPGVAVMGALIKGGFLDVTIGLSLPMTGAIAVAAIVGITIFLAAYHTFTKLLKTRNNGKEATFDPRKNGFHQYTLLRLCLTLSAFFLGHFALLPWAASIGLAVVLNGLLTHNEYKGKRPSTK